MTNNIAIEVKRNPLAWDQLHAIYMSNIGGLYIANDSVNAVLRLGVRHGNQSGWELRVKRMMRARAFASPLVRPPHFNFASTERRVWR